jgi:hypothetical protein
MDDITFGYYQTYLAHLAKMLLVGDWTIRLWRDPSSGSTHATINIDHQKEQGRIALGADFFARTPEERRQTLCHELLHLQTSRVCRAMTQLAEQFPDQDAVQYANQRLDEEEEILVDRLARVLSPTLPLPPEVTP